MAADLTPVDHNDIKENLTLEVERISIWLWKNRQRSKLSQKQLSYLTNVSVRVISQIENQQIEPQLQTVVHLATYFGDTVCEVFNDGRPTKKQCDEMHRELVELRALRQSKRP